MLKLLLLSQGAYFFITGIWPLIHLPSFEKVTAPKVDKWLVRMVGALAVAIGAPLIYAGLRESAPLELGMVAVLSAVAFGAVDIVYVTRRRIRPIYLGDAVVEAVFLVGWALSWSGLR